jgi:hypothetical protein
MRASPGYYAAYSGNSSTTFREKSIVSIPKGHEIQADDQEQNLLNLENYTELMCRNVGTDVPLYAE